MDKLSTVDARRNTLRTLSVRSNFIWTFAGNFVYAGCSWCMLAVLAKLGSAENVGVFALALAIAAPVTALAMMQLRLVQVTDTTGEYAFCEYLGTRVVTSALGFAVIVGVIQLSGMATETAWVVLVVGATKSVDCVSEVVRGLFQRHESMNISGRSLMIKAPIALIALTVSFVATDSLLAACCGMAGASVAVLVFHDLPCAAHLLTQRFDVGSRFRRFAPSFEPKIVRKLVLRAVPLGIGAFLLAIQANIPRYLLEAFQGSATLGYYAAMAYVVVAGSMVVSALGQAASPRLAELFQNDLVGFSRWLRKLLLLGLGLGVIFVTGVAALGPWAMTILYRAEYAVYPVEFVLIAFAGSLLFLSNLIGFALTATRVFRVQLIAGVVTCLVVTVVSFVLIPRFGLRGAATTAVIASAITLACYMIGIQVLVRRQRLLVSAAVGA